MNSQVLYSSKPRINVIDALRGFALMGILFIHCLEHFDSAVFSGDATPIVSWLDSMIKDVVNFLFLGKAYAIFSMLFGLSFFIQMDNQADKGVDFRLRFVWRLILLYFIGHINGLFYPGEIFVVYALYGLALIPLYKVPNKWLLPLGLLLLFQIPSLIQTIYMIVYDPIMAATTPEVRIYSGKIFKETMRVHSEGTFIDVISQDFWYGQLTKWLYYIETPQITRIIGLFTMGLLIGRTKIYKDETQMVKYAKRGVLWGLLLFCIFFCINKMIPLFEVEGKWAIRMVKLLTNSYANLGLMCMMIGIFILSYFRLDAQKILDKLAPMGRMSLTNYMVQSVVGMFLFCGFGLNLGPKCGAGLSFLIAIIFFITQMQYSRWWMQRFHYGPVEWVWRSLTWFSKDIPFKRKRGEKE